MIIRKFRDTDTEAIIRIWYEASIIAHSFVPKEMWEAYKEELRNKYLPIAQTWVAEEEDEILGFISLLGNYIGGLFIAPAKQGRGIGNKLLEQVKMIKGQLTVGVYSKNEKAKRFYRKNGFKYTGEEVQGETGEVVVNMELN